jgi:chaperonin cofactor prefoldin
MQTMRETWTDERLDDLNAKVDRGFERIDTDLRSLRAETGAGFTAMRGEMKAGFDKMDERFERMDARFERIDARFERIDPRFEAMDARFEAMYRLILQLGGIVVAALIGLIATQL